MKWNPEGCVCLCGLMSIHIYISVLVCAKDTGWECLGVGRRTKVESQTSVKKEWTGDGGGAKPYEQRSPMKHLATWLEWLFLYGNIYIHIYICLLKSRAVYIQCMCITTSKYMNVLEFGFYFDQRTSFIVGVNDNASKERKEMLDII